jgi:hypothetical protein
VKQQLLSKSFLNARFAGVTLYEMIFVTLMYIVRSLCFCDALLHRIPEEKSLRTNPAEA